MSYGNFCDRPKYRESSSVNFHDANKSIISGIDKSIESWSKKKAINKLELAEWKNSVANLLEERIKT